jgi:succinate-semialdehyde dehydrogenase/glutarate-semialdehyde dehydrogenase
MSSERQLAIVSDHVDDAVAKGAHVLAGGARASDLAGSFYQPTVLTNVDHQMEVMCEETFGPVLPVMTFKDEAEAVRWANDSRYGLTASVWTKDIARGKRLAEQIDAGTVMVNEVLYTHGIAQAPWGGMKQSGIGRTHGRMGLLELVVPKHIHVNRITFAPDLWWFSYTPSAGQLFRALAKRFATGNVLQTSLLLPQMLRRLLKK